MEVFIWVLAGFVALLIVALVLVIRRPGVKVDLTQASEQLLTLAEQRFRLAVQAVNLNQAKEGAETAIAFYISMVSALLERQVEPTVVVVGEMTVKGMLQKIGSLPERFELAPDAGAKKILVPSENKRDLADVPDEVLNKLQPVFYTDPINAAIRAMGLQ